MIGNNSTISRGNEDDKEESGSTKASNNVEEAREKKPVNRASILESQSGLPIGIPAPSRKLGSTLKGTASSRSIMRRASEMAFTPVEVITNAISRKSSVAAMDNRIGREEYVSREFETTADDELARTSMLNEKLPAVITATHNRLSSIVPVGAIANALTARNSQMIEIPVSNEETIPRRSEITPSQIPTQPEDEYDENSKRKQNATGSTTNKEMKQIDTSLTPTNTSNKWKWVFFVIILVAAAIAGVVVIVSEMNSTSANNKNKPLAVQLELPESQRDQMLADHTNIFVRKEDLSIKGNDASNVATNPDVCNQFSLSKSTCIQNTSCMYVKAKKLCKTNPKAAGATSPDTSSYTDNGDDPTVGYNIDLIFLGGDSVSDEIKQIFIDAKERWEKIITSDIPSTFVYKANTKCYYLESTSFNYDIVVDDLLIFVNLLNIDGEGGTLASSGPCMLSSKKKYARVGLMQFDILDLQRLLVDGTSGSVVLHEMAHVIGIGTMWDIYDLKSNDKEYYVGRGGSSGLAAIKGKGKPLIETNGPPGTVGGHWDEATYKTELMTGWLSSTSKLSKLTAMSLEDIGYKVDSNAVDDFELDWNRILIEGDPSTNSNNNKEDDNEKDKEKENMKKKEGNLRRDKKEHRIGDDMVHIKPSIQDELPYINGKPQK